MTYGFAKTLNERRMGQSVKKVSEFCCNVVQVFVTSPYDFPVLGTDVTSGSTAQISLSAQMTYTTPQVQDLTIERRHCVYENERKALGLPKYRHGNCIAECHRHSTLMYCNCTPFFFPTEGVHHLSRAPYSK
jgi:hypothetical protein